MELVKSLYEDEWVFRDPMLTEDVESKFDQALDAYDDGRCKRAETLIGSVVIECPNHIDALTTLGFTAKITGMLLAAMFSAKPPSPSGCKRFPRTYLKIDQRGQMVHDWTMLLKLTDEQWARIRGHFVEEGIPPSRPAGVGFRCARS